jgi:hypothetical protein
MIAGQTILERNNSPTLYWGSIKKGSFSTDIYECIFHALSGRIFNAFSFETVCGEPRTTWQTALGHSLTNTDVAKQRERVNCKTTRLRDWLIQDNTKHTVQTVTLRNNRLFLYMHLCQLDYPVLTHCTAVLTWISHLSGVRTDKLVYSQEES